MKKHRSVFFGVLFVVVVSLFLAPPAHTAKTKLPKPNDRWIQVRTANFTLFSNAPEKMTRKAGANLEQLRAVLRTLFGGMNFLSPVPTYIFVFDDAKTFAPYGLFYQGKTKQVGGYFGAGQFANHVAIVGNQYSNDVSSIIYHEYLHYVLNANQPGLPVWLNEGLAEFYSSFYVEDGVAKIGYPIGRHVAWLRDNPMIPLSDLMAIDHSSPEYNEGRRRGVFYAQSWALTHLLVISLPDGASRTGVYNSLLQNGVDSDEAFQRAFGTSYEELEKQLRRYLRSRRFTYQNMPISEATQHSSTVTEMSYPEVLYRLGTLLASLGSERHEFAAEHFTTSLEFDENFGPSIAGLGRLDEFAGRHGAALARYERAAELSPDDFMVNFLLGNALCRQVHEEGSPEEKSALTERARSALKRSVVLRPSFADAWAMLGTTYTWDQTPDEMGIKAMEHAHHLLPKRGDVGYNLALLYVREDRNEDARAVVTRMKAAGADESAVRAARELTMDSGERQAAKVLLKQRVVGSSSTLDKVPDSTKKTERAVAGGDSEELQRSTGTTAFTERYNQAVHLINTGDFDAAIALLEVLVGDAASQDEVAAAQSLLAQVQEFVTFKARADQALTLANTGNIDAAIDLLEPLVEQAPDEVRAAEIQRLLNRLLGYRSSQRQYNEAVDLVNKGDYEAAISLLEQLVESTTVPDLAAMASELLGDLKEAR